MVDMMEYVMAYIMITSARVMFDNVLKTRQKIVINNE